MRSRVIVLIAFFLAAVAPGAVAQGAAARKFSEAPPEGTFYYHWETPERLLLWHDLDQLVGVTVEVRNDKWQPGDRQGLLKLLTEEIQKQRLGEKDSTLIQRQWEASLEVALQRSKNDYKQWLEPLRLPNGSAPGFIPRQPDVMIYLYVNAAENKARIRLLSRLVPVETQEYELSQVRKGPKALWRKAGTINNIPIEQTLGVKWGPQKILKIIEPGESRPIGSTDFWTELVDEWKEKPAGSFRQCLYKAEKPIKGKTAWSWFEVVDAQGLLRFSGKKVPNHIMPAPVMVPVPVGSGICPLLDICPLFDICLLNSQPESTLLTWIWLFAASVLAIKVFLAVRPYLVSRLGPHTSEECSEDFEKGRDDLKLQRFRRITTWLRRAYRNGRESHVKKDSLTKQRGVADLQGRSNLSQQADGRNSTRLTEIKGLREDREKADARISGLDANDRFTSDLKDQKNRVAEANRRITKLEGEQTKLLGQVDSLQQAPGEANRGRNEAENSLGQETEAHPAQLGDLQGDLERAQASKGDLARDLKGQQDLVAETRQKISELEGEQTKLQGQIDSLQQALGDANRGRIEADNSLGQEREAHAAQLGDLQGDLEQAQVSKGDLTRDLKGQQDLVAETRQRISELEGEQTKLQGQVDSLQQALGDANRGRIEADNSLGQEREAHAAQLGDLQGDLEQAQVSKGDLTRDLKGQQDLVAETRQRISELEGEQTKLRGQVDSLQQALGDANRGRIEAENSLSQEREAHATQLGDMQGDLEQAQASKGDLARDLKGQQELVTETRQRISELEGEQTKLQRQVDSLQQALSDANRGRIEAENDLGQEREAHEALMRDLQGELEKAQANKRDLASDLEDQKDLVAKTRQMISELEGEQTKLQGQHDFLRQELKNYKQERVKAEEVLAQGIETWKAAEASSRQELGLSERAVRNLRDQLNTADNEKIRLQRRLEDLDQVAQRLKSMEAVNAVSPFLRRGQNQFLNLTDVQSASLLTVLVTHSLNQLALSRAFSQETKASAMLWNLNNIASKLAARYSGFEQALPRLQGLGAGNAPLAESFIAVNAQHEDSKLFQLILKQLRTAHRIDLAPFYFDVTKDGQVVRAN